MPTTYGYGPDGWIEVPPSSLSAPSLYAPSLYAPNLYAPNLYAPNLYAPNLYAPNLYAPVKNPFVRTDAGCAIEQMKMCDALGAEADQSACVERMRDSNLSGEGLPPPRTAAELYADAALKVCPTYTYFH